MDARSSRKARGFPLACRSKAWKHENRLDELERDEVSTIPSTAAEDPEAQTSILLLHSFQRGI